LTIENVDILTESRSSMKKGPRHQRIDIDKKRVSFDVNNLK